MFGNNLPPRFPRRYVKPGDRIYVCIRRGQRVLREFSVECMETYTALLGEIRHIGKDLGGLLTVFIRNHSRGWSEERPMMFYHGFPMPSRGVGMHVDTSVRRRMLAPWETH